MLKIDFVSNFLNWAIFPWREIWQQFFSKSTKLIIGLIFDSNDSSKFHY